MAAQGQRVLLLPGDVVLLGYIFGSDAHGQIMPHLPAQKVRLGKVHVPAAGNQAHAFGSPGHGHLQIARQHGVVGRGDGLHARGAKAVDRHAGHRIGQPRQPRHGAGHVESLLRLRKGAAHDNILNFPRRQTRRPRQHAQKRLGGKILRAGIPQAALGRFAHRTSSKSHDYRLIHAVSSFSARRRQEVRKAARSSALSRVSVRVVPFGTSPPLSTRAASPASR
ncbi:hypothetical protein SDC9_91436 [bioreactor metagenome]|uniref:Uncharacterized protein n=1 Tax=bioreactor metagenome TaxID=1076179 RepID=A0A644ZV10_9ZZZZ